MNVRSSRKPRLVLSEHGQWRTAIRTAFVASGVVGVALAPATLHAQATVAAQSQETVGSYTVQKGDTLAKIAAKLRANGVQGRLSQIVKRVQALNPDIGDGTHLKSGQTLKVPAVAVAAAPPVEAAPAVTPPPPPPPVAVAEPEPAPAPVAPAPAPAPEAKPSSGAVELEKIEVTGSRIKRVELETSDPVFTMDRRAIENTGIKTLGDLLQSMPFNTGAVTNTQVNNGGGTGQADVSIRGLESKRTLVLVDGQRFVAPFVSADVNSFPLNLVERIEVLKEGASAIYGSDAIGGVVNVITRKNYVGSELYYSYGITQHGDGSQTDAGATWGSTMPEGNVLFGINYNRQTAIQSSARSDTAFPWYLYYGQVSPNGGTSSRSPFGGYTVPRSVAAAAGADLSSPFCGGGSTVRLTRVAGTDGSSGSDFRCFINRLGPGVTDRYNFQPENLALTPSIRGTAFALANRKITDDITGFVTFLYNQTKANGQLAAEPFDNGTVQALSGVAIPISADSVYNVFGNQYVGAGNGATINSYALRAVAAGDRILEFDTGTTNITGGIKGVLADRFNWDVDLTYGRALTTTDTTGFLNFSKLFFQMGPSFDAFDNSVANGVQDPRCGTPTNPIPITSCVPLNVMGITGPTVGILNTETHTRTESQLKMIAANINDDALFPLPAGPLGAAAGFEYRGLQYDFSPDALGQAFQLSEANSQNTHGQYHVRDEFLELSVPLVAGLPGIESLTFRPGVRFSQYSTFGDKIVGKYGLEYRPMRDLMLRVTYADVFRAPNVQELFSAPTQTAPLYTDPCNGLTTPVGTNPNVDLACQNVARDGSYRQSNTQGTANIVGNPNLTAEKGWTVDYGLVYSPGWYNPFSFEFDFWRVRLKDAIEVTGLQTSVDACFNFGIYCSNVQRDNEGQLNLATEPTNNVGIFDTSGLDIGFHLNYPATPFGNFRLGWDNTYLIGYQLQEVQNGILLSNLDVAGQFDGTTFGASFPRWRSLAFIYWDQGPWSATVYDKYIGHFTEHPCCDASGTSTPMAHEVPFANYVNITGTYDFKPGGVEFSVGVKDVFNESSKRVMQGFNGATDTGAYDIAGRSFLGKILFKFK